MIEVQKLTKKFPALTAADQVTFQVSKGEVLGFLGPNGAGKTTTMKMLTGYLEPTSGSAKVGGKDIIRDSLEVRKQIGYLPESAPSYGEMTVNEFLSFITEIRALFGKQAKNALDKMSEICHLREVWNQPIETLSKGYRQRVGFAQALIHDPPFLILDEPTDGLDPNQKYEMRQLIKQMAANKTIIISTHILEEVEAVCQRVVIIAKGKVVADDSLDALLAKNPHKNLEKIFRELTLPEMYSHTQEQAKDKEAL